jgi:uncharacterized protein YqeY
MLIDDIKKANIEAMKAHDQEARTSLSMVIARYQEQLTNGSGNKVTDADVLKIIAKFLKELDEEGEGYAKAGRAEQAAAIEKQKAVLKPFLPVFLSEEEIRKIVATLPDKTMPGIMKYFKLNYDGKVDMSLVNKVARGL